MKNIMNELKDVIEEVMLPESEAFLDELDELIENKTVTEDELEAKKDMESFINELMSILEAIEENKLSEEEAKSVYEKIIAMINEHEE